MDECIARLRLYFGDLPLAKMMRKLGIPNSTYANWRKRGTVTSDQLVVGLINAGISLDWFFSPNKQLNYPTPSQLHIAETVQSDYQRESEQRTQVIKAVEAVEPLFEMFKLRKTEENQALLVETYLAKRSDHVTVGFAVKQVAKALAHAQRSAKGPRN
ncbi:hypothetical protein [Pseudidiomarina piscicola]|nr:hypothetical protein [Pseudidiomarina piscicola]